MASNKSSSSPPNGNLGGSSSGSFDFILRTAMERQSSGKRLIRPRLVEDTLLGDDSDDSEFIVEESELKQLALGSSESDSSDGSDGENNSEDSKSDKEEEEESNSRPSALRETLKKLNESPDFQPPGKSKPKKKKVTKTKDKGLKKVSGGGGDKKKKPTKKNAETQKKTGTTITTAGIRNERKKSDPFSSSVMGRVQEVTSVMRHIRNDMDLKKKICSFCLGEKSDESNEIVECDSCKVTVHEVCYGISDTLSLSSGAGSTYSTEPWFCDYCKNPDSHCFCSLCPNSGGLLKAADEQFVHVVCAHYTPGVISPIDGKPTLGKIPHTKWGSKPCTLCLNDRFANTGVTVKCDAGMCKSFVHISCAQQFGLLSDAASHGNEEADPYFASCKLHGQKEQAKHRATLYKILQEQIRIKREKSSINCSPKTKKLQSRIQEKLLKIRAKVKARHPSSLPSGINSMNGIVLPNSSRLSLNPSNVERKPRCMETCAYSISRFLQKIGNMGEDITSLELEEKHEKVVANIKKRWNVLPSLTVDYAAYYVDRNLRIDSLTKQCQELMKENNELSTKQVELNDVLDDESVKHMEIIDSSLTINSNIGELKNILKSVYPHNNSYNNIKGISPPRPRSKSPLRKNQTSPNTKNTNKINPNTKIPLKNQIQTNMKTLKRDSGTNDRLTLHVCATCKKSEHQHLITKCDHCNLHYHLGCLDPPLTRLPLRSKLCSWMCSNCCDEESEKEKEKDDPSAIDTEAPRSLRGRTSIKRPEKYREIIGSDDEVVFIKEKPKKTVKTPPAAPPPSKVTAQKSVQKKQKPVPVQPILASGRTTPPPFQEQPLSPPQPTTPRKDQLKIKEELESLQNGNMKRGIPPVGPRLLKRKADNLPVSPPPSAVPIKKEKLSPESLLKSTKSIPPSTSITPIPIQSPKRYVAILPKPTIDVVPVIKKEKKSPIKKKKIPKTKKVKSPVPFPIIKKSPIAKKGTPKKSEIVHKELRLKGTSPSLKVTKVISPPNNSILPPGINNNTTTDNNHSVAKNLKVVLSPVNSDHSTKNGIGNSHLISPNQTSSSPNSQLKKTKRTPTTVSPKKKSNSKTGGKVTEKDKKDYFNSLNMSGQIAMAISYAPGGSGTTGTCHTCNISEDKKNLVMCDDCGSEFHFTCVPPHVPYNPKRRGYKWICPTCEEACDDDFDGERILVS